MRQGQQNRRGRGRNNNHQQHNRRGGQNPLTRSFESTGPDTKIRGTPAHIAEKYMTLARDAQSSGDPVLAENYLQHAEHYNRIIMAYREQMQQSGEFNGGAQAPIARFRPGPQDPMGDDFGEGEGEEFSSGDQPVQPALGEQPTVFEGAPREQLREGQPRFDDRGPRHEGGHRQQHNQNRDRDRGYERRDRNNEQRFDRNDRGDRGDRNDRSDRNNDRGERNSDRNDRNDQRFDRQPPPMDAQPDAQRRQPRPGGPPPAHEQPEFLRRPVRRPRREEGEGAPPVTGDEPVSD